MIDKLKQLLNSSQNILITSHIGPDGDALSSSILLLETLKLNFPDKKIALALEEGFKPLEQMDGYQSIEFKNLAEALQNHQPDLLIILDANNLSRCSRNPEPAKQYLDEHEVKIAIIDHHEEADKDESDAYINQGSPAVAQDVYEICFEQLNLKRPDSYAKTALLGIYTDTGGFIYKNPRHKKTFEIVSQLIDDGASLELIDNQLNQYTEASMLVFARLAENISHIDNCTYTFVDDKFSDQWQAEGRSIDDYKSGCEIFVNDFVRNINGRPWGFVVSRDFLAPSKTYSVSFRSIGGSIDVSKIARQLGGGGHKGASGAKIECQSAEEAINKVKSAISSVK